MLHLPTCIRECIMDYSSLEDLLEWYMPSQAYLHRRNNGLSRILCNNMDFSDHIKRLWSTYDSGTKKIILSRMIHTLSSYRVMEVLKMEANTTADAVILEMLLLSLTREEMLSLHICLTEYIRSNWRPWHEYNENRYSVVSILTSHPCLRIQEYVLNECLRLDDVNLVRIILQRMEVVPVMGMVILGSIRWCTTEVQSCVLDRVLTNSDAISDLDLISMGLTLGWDTPSGKRIKAILDSRQQRKPNCAVM